jgi:hypothetical protein
MKLQPQWITSIESSDLKTWEALLKYSTDVYFVKEYLSRRLGYSFTIQATICNCEKKSHRHSAAINCTPISLKKLPTSV